MVVVGPSGIVMDLPDSVAVGLVAGGYVREFTPPVKAEPKARPVKAEPRKTKK